jgi:hypothetical protein
MGWRIFKHTDVGAPSSDFGVRGNLAAVLRACLITGYGTGADEKLPVGGWSEPFSEVDNVAVFRADAGNRQFYKIDDRTNTDIDVAKMFAYESMSDVETGLGQWYDLYFGKQYTAVNQGWIVVANEFSVYVFFVGINGWCPTFFGEYINCFSDNPYNSIVAGNTGATYVRYSYTALVAGAGNSSDTAPALAYLNRLPDGTGLGAKTSMISLCEMGAGSSSTPEQMDIVSFPTKKACVFPLLIGGMADAVASPSGTAYYGKHMIFGEFPILRGMDMAPIDIDAAVSSTSEWSDTDSGINYLLLPCDRSTIATTIPKRATFAIDLTGVS